MEKATQLGRRNSAEENKKLIAKICESNPEVAPIKADFARVMAKMNESATNPFDDKQFPVKSANFSWTKLHSKLVEADNVSGFTQLLRAGIQNLINAAYQSVPTTFEEFTHTVQSNKFEELYAPLQGLTFPREVGEGVLYPESKAMGLDIKLRNRKYGSIWPLTMELSQMDQTGQVSQLAGLMGEYLKLVYEVLVYGKLASSSSPMQYGDLVVPPSETKPANESVYPWSNNLVGGGKSKDTAFAAFSQAAIQRAYQLLIEQKNILGLRMMVQPDTLIIGPKYKFDSAVLAHSSYYPTGATPGVTGGAFAINPIQGMFKPVISRFIFKNDGTLDDGTCSAWWVCDSSKPWFVVQMFSGPVTSQEAPNSGKSFDQDLIRWKGYTIGNADILDPRFALMGSDGSV